MPRFGKLLFVALLYKRCIGFGVSFQRKIRRKQLLESYGKIFFQLLRLPQSIFVLGNPTYWGLESAMCPIFVKPVLEIFPIVYRYLGNVFPVRQRAIYTQINEKHLLEKENLRAFFCCGLEATKIITLSGTSLSSRQFSKMLKTKFMENTESSI